jgi:hypothetical protein
MLCHYAECLVLLIVMMNGIMKGTMTNVVLLIVVAPNNPLAYHSKAYITTVKECNNDLQVFSQFTLQPLL